MSGEAHERLSCSEPSEEAKMGRFTYYSPLLLGTILGVIVILTYRELLPVSSGWVFWLMTAGGAILAGMVCQLGMIGFQGTFAQVLPAPSGRSVRGRGAVVTGGLILFGVGASVAGGMLRLESALAFWATLVVVLGVLSLLGALVAYIWNAVTAVRDFADER